MVGKSPLTGGDGGGGEAAHARSGHEFKVVDMAMVP
jgi:hypothetical protein